MSEKTITFSKVGWNFDNSYARLAKIMASRIMPTPVSDPKIIIFNQVLAKDLGLNFSSLIDHELAEIFTGNSLPENSEPLAQAYAGHQFGHFTMLGDGRAILLGEHITPDRRRLDIQFKGSGRTPYSRGGDGRAALGPMLREYILSESMHALGIPTTRSLAVATTGENIFRETLLPGAILTRTAASHLRVGTFEYVAMQRDHKILKSLVDYAIDRHYPHLKGASNPAIALLNAVMKKQIELITNWMRVGFIHGVMNTDNMTISGETIDYGPCAFMDSYDPKTVFSSIDHHGRYAFANQPTIAQWNLSRLAEALLPLFHDNQGKAVEIAHEIINAFTNDFKNHWHEMMGKKLGLFERKEEDETLIADLLEWMHQNKADYTNTFRSLMKQKSQDDISSQGKTFSDWHHRWQIRLIKNGSPRELSLHLMAHANPAIIPRNHKVEEALEAAFHSENLTPLHNLLQVLKSPYDEGPAMMSYQAPQAPGAQAYQTFCGT